jgi:uncharacterized protein DUF5681
MTKSRKRKPPLNKPAREDADEVGYGKPPRAHQFKPGKSGNPKGRPKGAKNQETILLELLQQKIRLSERGKARRITILEGIFRRIIEDGLKGNTKSAAFLLNRYQAPTSGEQPMESGLSEDDEAVLEAYLQKYRSNNED